MDNNKITKERFGRLMLLLVQQPYRYKTVDLARKLDVSQSTIERDFAALANIGMPVEYDSDYRYGFQKDRAYSDLDRLLNFTEKDQQFIAKAIDTLNHRNEHGRTAKRILSKLNSLYDFRKLGLDVLREPHLRKINLLERSIKSNKRILLKQYHSSNSNTVADRTVEPLRVSPIDDMLYAYDVDKKKISHFRLTRIGLIDELDTKATYRGEPKVGNNADPFYIVDNDTVMVRLEFGVAARNELFYRFPLTKQYVTQYPDGNRYEFQAEVNSNFLGVTNFILSSSHNPVIIHEPYELIEHIQNTLKKMLEIYYHQQ